jgi:hypothetical protein
MDPGQRRLFADHAQRQHPDHHRLQYDGRGQRRNDPSRYDVHQHLLDFGKKLDGKIPHVDVFILTHATRITAAASTRCSIPAIRVHRAEIADRGQLGFLSVEGAARNPRLDDLQTLTFDSAIEDSAVSAWLHDVRTTRDDRVGSGGLEDTLANHWTLRRSRPHWFSIQTAMPGLRPTRLPSESRRKRSVLRS